ncbi:40S ribosomal protein S17 [Candidatus Nitrosopelagicus sp.]|nr:40S ribosomal protein S17 [Candidatus Nitrosopelagicus sp.]MDC0241180.1 40S ribosomal protein S17 [Candidatus Nitrosopelagicus sp.]
MDRIKRISNEVMNEYSERFGTDFAANKQSLNEISIVRSKGLKNKIAGYITKILQRKAKFDERKQMLIDNEKKSQERKQSRSKKPQVESEEDTSSIEIVGGVEDPHTDEGIRHVTEEPGSETETSISEEKSTAEEIVDESKSE